MDGAEGAGAEALPLPLKREEVDPADDVEAAAVADCEGGGTCDDGMNMVSAECWVCRRVLTTSKGVMVRVVTVAPQQAASILCFSLRSARLARSIVLLLVGTLEEEEADDDEDAAAEVEASGELELELGASRG